MTARGGLGEVVGRLPGVDWVRWWGDCQGWTGQDFKMVHSGAF